MFNRLFSIEGLMLLTIAGLADVIGLLDLIPIVGHILSFVFADIPAIILIYSWALFFKSKRPAIPGRVMGRLSKFGRVGKWLARFLAPVGETVVGFLPLWTILVVIELITD